MYVAKTNALISCADYNLPCSWSAPLFSHMQNHEAAEIIPSLQRITQVLNSLRETACAVTLFSHMYTQKAGFLLMRRIC